MPSIQEEIERWGPDRIIQYSPTLAESQKYTEQLARSHYENFPVVTWRLPAELKQPFYDIYAFCRWADDLADELDSQEQSLEMLHWWREELLNCYAGQASHPVYVALRKTISRFVIPAEPFHHLIDAFERDQKQTRYETIDDLLDYCSCSANPVGRILLHLFETTDAESLRLSDSLCTGLQLVNFWQDVARDWDIGRLYLPQESMRQFDVTEQVLHTKQSTPGFIRMLQHEVERAEQLLKAGFELGSRVPARVQFDVRLFALGGLCLCEKIRKINYRVLEQRPRLKKTDLPRLFWQAWRGRKP